MPTVIEMRAMMMWLVKEGVFIGFYCIVYRRNFELLNF